MHKVYIKRGNRRFGPYYYESYRDKDGNVKKRYIGTEIKKEGKSKPWIFGAIAIIFFILLAAIFSILIQPEISQKIGIDRAAGILGNLMEITGMYSFDDIPNAVLKSRDGRNGITSELVASWDLQGSYETKWYKNGVEPRTMGPPSDIRISNDTWDAWIQDMYGLVMYNQEYAYDQDFGTSAEFRLDGGNFWLYENYNYELDFENEGGVILEQKFAASAMYRYSATLYVDNYCWNYITEMWSERYSSYIVSSTGEYNILNPLSEIPDYCINESGNLRLLSHISLTMSMPAEFGGGGGNFYEQRIWHNESEIIYPLRDLAEIPASYLSINDSWKFKVRVDNIGDGSWSNWGYSNILELKPGCIDFTQPETYYLNEDINASIFCFNVLSNNVALDCQGHNVNGLGIGAIGIGSTLENIDNLTIRNCNFTGWNRAVYFKSLSNSIIGNLSISKMNSDDSAYYDIGMPAGMALEIVQGQGYFPSSILFSGQNNEINNVQINNIADDKKAYGGINIYGRGNKIVNNSIFFAGDAEYYGIQLAEFLGSIFPSDNNVVENNIIEADSGLDDSGMAIQGSHNSINKNSILNFRSGISVWEIQNPAEFNNLTNNTISASDYNQGLYGEGIYIHSQNNLIKNNLIEKMNTGLAVSKQNNVIEDTVIRDSRLKAIYVFDSQYYNNFSNVSAENSLNYDFYSEGYSGLINSYLGKYSFSGSGLFIENENGKIEFLEAVYGEGANLSNDVQLRYNFMSIYSENLGLNKSAMITLYNMPGDFTSPAIFRDNETCKECQNFTSLNADIVIFSVPGFGNYSINNYFPYLRNFYLVSSNGENTTSEDIIASAEAYGAYGQQGIPVFNWLRNGNSFEILNMPFEGGSTETWTRDYALGKNGSVHGAVWDKDAGIRGGAYDFDGVDDYIDLGTMNLLKDGATGITIESWIKPENFQSLYPFISMIAGIEDGPDKAAFLRLGDADISSDMPQFVIGIDGIEKKLTENVHLQTNQWYHIAGTYDGTNMGLYINGNLKKSMVATGSSFLPNGRFYIGRAVAGENGIDRNFNGAIDEVKIYNHALSAEQIYQNYIQERDNLDSSRIVSKELWGGVGDVWTAQAWANDWKMDGIMEERSITMKGSVIISLPVDTASLSVGCIEQESDDTETGNNPMVLVNDGDVDVNVGVLGSRLWETGEFPSNNFQYKIREGEAGSFDNLLSKMEWADVTAENEISIANLKYGNDNDNALIDYKITIPGCEETPGTRNSQIIFTAEQAT